MQAVIVHTIIGGRAMRTSVKYLGAFLIMLTVAYMAMLGAYGSASFVTVTTLYTGLLVPLIAIMVRLHCTPDRAPDFLGEMFTRTKRYECNGLGLAFEMEDRGGIAHLVVYFQNRHANACKCHLGFEQIKTLSLKKKHLYQAGVDIECPGGAFGVQAIPFGVPEKWQGKKATIQVIGMNHYAADTGEMLRLRPNQPISESGNASGSGIVLLAFLAGGVAGAVAAQGPAVRLQMQFPRSVQTMIDPDAAPLTEILWEPGDDDDLDTLPIDDTAGIGEAGVESEPVFVIDESAARLDAA